MSVLLLIGLVVAAGVVVGGFAILASGSEADDALDRDEHEISRGRELGRS